MISASERASLLDDIEKRRHAEASPAEAEWSVNDWIDRIRQACQTAQGLARSGAAQDEQDTWLDIASYALGRAEQIQEKL